MDEHAVEQMRRITLAQCAMLSAYAEIQAMIAENKQREALGQSMAYDESAFLEVMARNGANWNDIVTLVNQ